MITTCPKCNARLIFQDEKIRSEGVQIKCSICSSVFSLEDREERTSNDEETGVKPDTIITPDTSHKTEISKSHVRQASDKEVPSRTDLQSQRIPSSSSSYPKGPSPVDTAYVDGLKQRYSYKAAGKEKLEEKRFIEHLPDVFSFPLKRGSLSMVLVGSVFFAIVLFFSEHAIILGTIGKVFVWGYLSS